MALTKGEKMSTHTPGPWTVGNIAVAEPYDGWGIWADLTLTAMVHAAIARAEGKEGG